MTTKAFKTRWVVLSGLGFAGGLVIALSLSGRVEALVGMMLVTPVVLALAGTVFGSSQWLAIGKRHRAGLAWIAASAAALGIGMTLGVVVVEVLGRAITGEPVRLLTASPLGRVAGLATIGVVAGLAMGVGQRVALVPYGAAARGWIVRTSVAFGLGLPAGSLTADLLVGGLSSAVGFAAFLAAGGLMIGFITMTGAGRIVSSLGVARPG